MPIFGPRTGLVEAAPSISTDMTDLPSDEIAGVLPLREPNSNYYSSPRRVVWQLALARVGMWLEL